MKFSVFNRASSTVPVNTISLDQFATIVKNPVAGGEIFQKSAEIVKEIRLISDEARQKQLKQTLPAISPGVVFGENRQDVASFSGLMQIDIDHVINPEQLRDELGNLSWVTFAALSVRKGVWLLVKIPEPERQAEYWFKVNEWLTKRYAGIEADPKRKNPKDLRFFAPDREAIYKPYALTLKILPIQHAANTIKAPPKAIQRIGGNYISPIDDFNSRGDIIPLLQANDWKICRQHGRNIRLTRPGKSNGISANWNEDLRKLYVFSNHATLQNAISTHALSPVDIFMQLNQINSISDARQTLQNLGYGNSKS
jgi:hypothetical protein